MRYKLAGFRVRMLLVKHPFKLTLRKASIQTVPVSTPLSPASSGHKYKAPCRDSASGGTAPELSGMSLSEGSGEFSLHLGLECCWETSQSEGHGEGNPRADRERGSSWRPTSWTHLLESTSFSLEFRHFILLFWNQIFTYWQNNWTKWSLTPHYFTLALYTVMPSMKYLCVRASLAKSLQLFTGLLQKYLKNYFSIISPHWWNKTTAINGLHPAQSPTSFKTDLTLDSLKHHLVHTKLFIQRKGYRLVIVFTLCRVSGHTCCVDYIIRSSQSLQQVFISHVWKLRFRVLNRFKVTQRVKWKHLE